MKGLYLYAILQLMQTIALAQQEATINTKDSKIYYRIYGKGNPILIINGGPGMNSNGFVNLAIRLSKNHQTIIYDQRGTGKSTLIKTDSSTITMKLMIEDLEILRKHLKIKKWIILGHSFGGMLASYYASFYPNNIESIILSSSGGIDLGLLSGNGIGITSKLSQIESDSVNYWTTKINEGDTSYHARLRRGTSLAPAYVYDRKNISIIAQRLTQGNTLVNTLVWQDMQKIKFDCSSKLTTFDKPVLIIQGKQDIIEEKIALKAHAVLKNSKIVLLDNCVHYGWLDRPDEYFAQIEKFIKSN
jgi:proline iminopeptidase